MAKKIEAELRGIKPKVNKLPRGKAPEVLANSSHRFTDFQKSFLIWESVAKKIEAELRGIKPKVNKLTHIALNYFKKQA